MLFKWILCDVAPENRASFDAAQQKWSELSTVQGCLGQCGGWDRSQPPRAAILALWRDGAAYVRFMAEVHDGVEQGSGQQDTYDRCGTVVCESVLTISGEDTASGEHAAVSAALAYAGVLRVADCRLRPDRLSHFLEVQREVWSPAMAAAPGMLAGAVGRVAGSESRYVVVSLWRDAADHDAYARRVSSLRDRAEVDHDVDSMQGAVVLLEPAWRVPAAADGQTN